jgi:hypothetical protein
MSVMNGFRAELLGRILGVQSHITSRLEQGPLQNYAEDRGQAEGLPGVQSVSPMIDGQVFISPTTGVWRLYPRFRRKTEEPLAAGDKLVPGSVDNSMARTSRSSAQDGERSLLSASAPFKAISPQTRARLAAPAAIKEFDVVASSTSGCRIRQLLHLHPARRRADLFQAARSGQQFRGDGAGHRRRRPIKAEVAKALWPVPAVRLGSWPTPACSARSRWSGMSCSSSSPSSLVAAFNIISARS